MAGAVLLGGEACGAKTPLLIGTIATCTPAATRTCVGPEECLGVEECVTDGSTWGECVCEVDVAPVCFDSSFGAQGSPISLHFIVDRSGSMVDFWTPTIDALSTFFSDSSSAGLSVALDFFPPIDASEECEPETYASPDVGFGTLNAQSGPGDPHEEALQQFLIRVGLPQGGTPMFPAYEGAVQVATERSDNAGGGELVVIVLVTDGEPSGCDSTNSKILLLQFVEDVAGGPPPIRTFTIGLQGVDEALIEALAERGNGDAFFVGRGDVSQQLITSFESIRRRLSCDFQLVGVPNDFDESVDVTFTLEGSDEALPFDPSCAFGGWTLDDTTTPPSLSLCESACERVKLAEQGTLRIVVGCDE